MAMVIITAGLLAILAVAGLAVYASRITYNKSRLQGVIDATTLTAAKVLDQTGSDAQASAAANTVFTENLATFPELRRALGTGAKPVLTFSKGISPFTPQPSGTLGLHYVRAEVASAGSGGGGLLGVVGVRSMPVRASAIAGPSPAVGVACNIVPLALCGNRSADLGYPADRIHAINSGAGTVPGFYRYLRFDDTGGANAVRKNLAGGYNQCVVDGTRVPIKAGVNAGPSTQGLNTRFNQYASGLSPSDFPPDVIQRQPSPLLSFQASSGTIRQDGAAVTLISEIGYGYGAYAAATRTGPYDIQPSPSGPGVFKRRVVAAPVIDCGDEINKTVPIIGLRCLFLLQRTEVAGSDARLFIEIAPECEAGGRPGPVPPGTPGGVYIIQLYRDPASPDS
jgi:hypothetical protein